MSTAAYALSDTSVMITRCMRRSLRDPEAFSTALMLPIILMLLFVYIFGGDLNTGGKYVNYVVPGLIVLCAGFGAGTTAVVVATDMSSGIVDRFRSMPIHASSVLAGHIVASLARNLLATALVIAVGLGVGWRPTASPLRWLGAVAMIVAFILAMSWLAAAFGLLVRSPEAATGATFGIMFIPYLSTAFVPARTLPAVLRPIAANQPFTPVIETMRGLWMGRTSTGASVGHEALLAGLYCAAILVVAFVCASRLYTRRTAALSSATSVISPVGSPRVFAARSPITAAATRKTLATSSARWNPDERATAGVACPASSDRVRAVATADSTASPSAAPTWKDALIRALASPASDGGTPALAAVWTPTNTPPSPSAMTIIPGNTSVK
jgi:ABC-2 type transport system permease protein